MFKFIVLCYITLHAIGLSALAANNDSYQFSSPAQAEQFERLSSQFRCLVCQNQTLADSNAPLAKDLRDILYNMVLMDNDDRDIIDYFVARYGDFILYLPPFQRNTWILWFGPLILLCAGLLVLYRTIRAYSQSPSLSEK